MCLAFFFFFERLTETMAKAIFRKLVGTRYYMKSAAGKGILITVSSIATIHRFY